MTDLIHYELHGNVAVIQMNNPPVNALSGALARSLHDAVRQFASDRTLHALVISAAGRTFMAGADIAEFANPDFGLQAVKELMDAIENLDRPVVAAMHGTVLGAGLELALACHYRIATAGARFGLPEVSLGLLPGAGGTQRLPRLVEPGFALDMILSGRQIDAKTALNAGVIDAIADDSQLDWGVRYAQALLARNAGPHPTRDRAISLDGLDSALFTDALANAKAKKSAYLAPRHIVACVQATTSMSFDAGLQLEGRLFEECRASSQSAAMRHLFFAEREAAKIPGLSAHLPLRPIKSVGVVGAGTMGGGIAMIFANAGIPVVILETSQQALDRGLGMARKNYEASAAKGRLTMQQVDERMALLQGNLEYAALADCELVIEAVFENMEVKKQVCAELGRVCKPGAIIATNTSTLDVNVLAQATGRPADVVGMHFFSPANVMRLLEVVRGEQTGSDVLATVMQLARKIGKVAVVSGVCYGFIGNRMLESYLRESEFLMMEGATPKQIDRAIEATGLAMGPCRMLDLAGLDVGAKVVLEQSKAGNLPPDPSYRAVVRRMLELGRHGQKTASGYYRYEGRAAVEDPALESICIELAAEHGIVRRTDISDQEIVERCLYPLINEGARILEEGIAYRPGDVDTVWLHGYGFPDWQGGPLFMADQIGLSHIAERLTHYANERGNTFGYWTQSALLTTLAQQRKKISDWSVA